MKLRAALEQYISLKKSLGFRFETARRILMAFSRALGDVSMGGVEPTAVRNISGWAGWGWSCDRHLGPKMANPPLLLSVCASSRSGTPISFAPSAAEGQHGLHSLHLHRSRVVAIVGSHHPTASSRPHAKHASRLAPTPLRRRFAHQRSAPTGRCGRGPEGSPAACTVQQVFQNEAGADRATLGPRVDKIRGQASSSLRFPSAFLPDQTRCPNQLLCHRPNL